MIQIIAIKIINIKMRIAGHQSAGRCLFFSHMYTCTTGMIMKHKAIIDP